MGTSSFLQSIVNRMACLYSDEYIRGYEQIAEGAQISAAIKQKWQEESKRSVLQLYAKAEKRQQAERAQYAKGVEPIEAFPTPIKVEPMSIDDAATSATGMKQIQVELAELRKHVTGNRRRCLHQSHPLQGVAPLDPVGPQGEGPDIPVIQHLAAQPAEVVT